MKKLLNQIGTAPGLSTIGVLLYRCSLMQDLKLNYNVLINIGNTRALQCLDDDTHERPDASEMVEDCSIFETIGFFTRTTLCHVSRVKSKKGLKMYCVATKMAVIAITRPMLSLKKSFINFEFNHFSLAFL